jgi:hypothetical protein
MTGSVAEQRKRIMASASYRIGLTTNIHTRFAGNAAYRPDIDTRPMAAYIRMSRQAIFAEVDAALGRR